MTVAIALSLWFAVAVASPAARAEVVYPAATFEGTCTLVYAETGATEDVLYFLTSLRFFKNEHTNPYPPLRAARVTLDDGRVFDVAREDVIMPMGTLVDIAILRVVAPAAGLIPNLMVFEPPPAGTPFAIAGYGLDGLPATVSQHARLVSTRLMIGDTDSAALDGCVGAPAFTDAGLVGIVSNCDAGRAPTITLLAPAYPLLARSISGLQARPTLKN